MKVDMAQPILDLRNKPALRDNLPYTLKDACQECLIMPAQNDKDMSPAEKLTRFNLAMKLNEESPDLTMEEIVKLKEVVGSLQTPLVYGRVCELLSEKKLKLVADGSS